MPSATATKRRTFYKVAAGQSNVMFPSAKPAKGGDVVALDYADFVDDPAFGDTYASPALREGALGRLMTSGAVKYGGELIGNSDGTGGTLVRKTTLNDIAANGDIGEFKPGYAGKIRGFLFVTTVPATTAAKLATLGLEIRSAGAPRVTVGTLALTSANQTLGSIVDAGVAADAATNTFTATESIAITAASVTRFTEGAGTLLVVLQAT